MRQPASVIKSLCGLWVHEAVEAFRYIHQPATTLGRPLCAEHRAVWEASEQGEDGAPAFKSFESTTAARSAHMQMSKKIKEKQPFHHTKTKLQTTFS